MIFVLSFLLSEFFQKVYRFLSMNSTNQNISKDEASSANQEATSSSADNENKDSDDMKRAAIKKLIERYFYQLTDGCGNPTCDNKFCASSGEVQNLTPDQAAATALCLFAQEAPLCQRHPNKMLKTQDNDVDTENDFPVRDTLPDENCTLCNDNYKPVNTESTSRIDSITKDFPYLTEEKLYEIIDDCEASGNFSRLIRTIGKVYCDIDLLCKSFRQTSRTSPIDTMIDGTGDLATLKKEDVRSLEGEKDKDEDSCMSHSGKDDPMTKLPLDFASLKRAYSVLFKLDYTVFESALVNALVNLAGCLQMELQSRNHNLYSDDDIVHVLLVVFEIPALDSGDFLDTAFPALCRATNWITFDVQAKLAIEWSGPGRRGLRNLLENLHHLITIRVILTQLHHHTIQDENVVTSATKLMKVVYYANMMSGVLEHTSVERDDEYHMLYKPEPLDPLSMELGVSVLDCRKPLIPYSEFYNEPLSFAVEMDRDFANFKSDKFSFLEYPFILTPATKAMGLYFDNRIRMFSQRQHSLLENLTGNPSNPYLRLRVRRDHIIDDALIELEMISLENPNDLKKQLVVEFEGEQGIDEGGVSKEFFQLVIEEIFNPDYAMFTFQTDTQTAWFNPTSYESESQFQLIGIVLALAIYNNVILAVNFPMVLYRKLMGRKGSFEDLQDWNPVLYNSLKQMLDYDQPDLEDVFMQTFRVSYQDVFGTLISQELKENGDQINVTLDNKYDFVNLYADFLLNKSVEKQFRAFYRGFQMVADESPLRQLFRPEEVELLVCGSKNFDFEELENSTEYDGGYTSSTMIIKNFWSVVHAFSLEDKRKLLQFTTGSDRIPIGGLGKLKLVIARNGPDSDRLPTAHTCFNVLLLPEYLTKEKLKEQLIKAISYSKGFGML